MTDSASPSTSTDGGDRSDSGTAIPPSDAGTGGNPAAKPSAGCGKSGRPSGGRVEMQGKHNYTFPTAYDGMRPLPLLIGFHAASNPIGHIEGLTNGSDLETSYVRAFPKSKGNEWIYGTDIGLVNAMYDDLMANYCIDMSRVFATGHSSGAQLIVQILLPAHKADADHLNFKAVAPVAASRYGTVSRAIPVLYIQAQLDTVRNSSGADVVKEFVTANGCAMTTKPYTMTPSCMSKSDRRQVMNGCVQYDGCKVPTVWCSHNDPEYGTSFHGWPCFATKTMSDFFAALP
jgi:polyhydroxybutyrate depolymerase